jgi:glutaminyl-tRNA synthetase
MKTDTDNSSGTDSSNFIHNMIADDVANGKHEGLVATRFPPEPNGYLHIGHAKSICLNFGVAKEFGGWTNLRFDDTNPDKESEEYMSAIKRDVEWLGFSWKSLCYASDYFDQLYDYAVALVKKGVAYVDSLNADEIREYRGTLKAPGKDSPYRNRTVEENLTLLEGMKNGDYDEGQHVLRLKIDMAASNINMRDPAIYRIKKTHHYRTGDKWNIYPLYDYTHCLSDAIEGITHSLCTLEFEDHRPLYNWVLEQTQPAGRPEQTEFGPLNLEYTVLSKRRLIQLVQSGVVDGWDDPRMPTISGLRRRGYTPASIVEFCKRIGVTKSAAVIEMQVLENCIREELNETAYRRMAVLEPLKIVLTDWPADQVETLEVANHPNQPEAGTRSVNFTRELYIERSDFEETPPPKFKRLVPGGEVRLRSGYVIKCDEVIKDDDGNIVELHCSHDANTLGKKPEGRKVKGVIHWVSADDSIQASVRIYDRLFNRENPMAEEDFMDALNPDSLSTFDNARIEASLAAAAPETRFQFERQGYFVADPDTTEARPVFNRVVALRDTWAS